MKYTAAAAYPISIDCVHVQWLNFPPLNTATAALLEWARVE